MADPKYSCTPKQLTEKQNKTKQYKKQTNKQSRLVGVIRLVITGMYLLQLSMDIRDINTEVKALMIQYLYLSSRKTNLFH